MFCLPLDMVSLYAKVRFFPDLGCLYNSHKIMIVVLIFSSCLGRKAHMIDK